jgi:hypothetical protein
MRVIEENPATVLDCSSGCMYGIVPSCPRRNAERLAGIPLVDVLLSWRVSGTDGD